MWVCHQLRVCLVGVLSAGVMTVCSMWVCSIGGRCPEVRLVGVRLVLSALYHFISPQTDDRLLWFWLLHQRAVCWCVCGDVCLSVGLLYLLIQMTVQRCVCHQLCVW